MAPAALVMGRDPASQNPQHIFYRPGITAPEQPMGITK